MNTKIPDTENARSLSSNELDEKKLKRDWAVCVGLALILPPLSGIIIFSFLGVYPLSLALGSFTEFSGLFVLASGVIAYWLSKQFLNKLIYKVRTRPETVKDDKVLKNLPLIFISAIIVYYILGATSANLSLQYFHGYEPKIDFYLRSYFAAIPGVLITLLPIFFYLSDVLGRYLAPRGVVLSLMPVTTKLAVLGLVTPVMIDTLLIMYFFEKLPGLGNEILYIWFVLLLLAAGGTWIAIQSFKQGLRPFYQSIDDVIPSEIKPMTLDEHGRIAESLNILLHRLMVSEERYSLAVAGSSDGIWDWNILTDHDYLSPRWLELLGYSKEDDIHQHYSTFVSFIHPGDKERVFEAIRMHLEEQVPYNVELRLRKKDGSYGWFLSRGLAVRDSKGNPVRMAGSISDITERLRAEKEIREQKEFTDTVIESANAIVVVLDSEGRITRFNKAAEDLTYYDREEVLGRKVWDILIRKEEIESVQQVFTGLTATRMAGVYTNYWVAKDKSNKLIEWNNSVVSDDDGRFQYVVSVGIDVTNKYEAEKQLEKYRNSLEEMVEERTRKLEETQFELLKNQKLATLGQLTATVSHELRNPLGAMLPSLHVLKKLVNQDDARLARTIDTLERSVRRCDHIIDELLDFTRDHELDISRNNTDKWLDSILTEISIPPDIDFSIDKDLHGVMSDFDPDRLRRAVINILDNATQSFKDADEKGITIEKRQVQLTTSMNDGFIEICVIDSGPGIPAETMEKIFEPLFSTKSFGIGLGMSAVRQIMRQHGGDIAVESEVGKGTRVCLRFPGDVDGRREKS